MHQHQVTSELIMLNNNNVHVFNCDLKIFCGGNSFPQLFGGGAGGGLGFRNLHVGPCVMCEYWNFLAGSGKE